MSPESTGIGVDISDQRKRPPSARHNNLRTTQNCRSFYVANIYFCHTNLFFPWIVFLSLIFLPFTYVYRLGSYAYTTLLSSSHPVNFCCCCFCLKLFGMQLLLLRALLLCLTSWAMETEPYILVERALAVWTSCCSSSWWGFIHSAAILEKFR